MSLIEDSSKIITPELITPRVESSVFELHRTAHFWLGKVASGHTITQDAEYVASGILRANVYIDECHFLDPSMRLKDGTERDDKDNLSTHFAVLENTRNATKVVGTTRLIGKISPEDSLPVEELFPEAFDNKAPLTAVEASRFIARHPNRLIQNMISLGLIRSMVLEAQSSDSPYIYAVVEDYLSALFQKIGLPMEQLAEPKRLTQYNNTLNMPLRFEPRTILSTAKTDLAGKYKMSPFFWGADESRGLGYYDISLMEQTHDLAA